MFSNLLWLTACHAAWTIIYHLGTKSNSAGACTALRIPKSGEFLQWESQPGRGLQMGVCIAVLLQDIWQEL